MMSNKSHLFHLFRAFLVVASPSFEFGTSFVLRPHRGCPTVARPPSTGTTSALFAKKKKGNKKNKGPKKGGFEWAASFTQQPYEASQKRDLVAAALASFKGRTGEHLSPELGTAADVPKALWDSPAACVVVSSAAPSEAEGDEGGGGGGGGTIVEYANVAALETAGLTKNEFERLFSTKPKGLQKKDDAPSVLLDLPPVMKGEKQFERGYRKKIIRRESGEDVTIVDARRWNIEKSIIVAGKFVTESIGVGYAWEEWLAGDDVLCSKGGVRKELEEDLGDLEERITRQGALVRDLKEVQGFTNKDPEVKEAVAELIRLKNLDGD